MNAVRDWLYIGKYLETRNLGLLMTPPIGAMLQLAEAVSQPGIESLYLPVEDGEPLATRYLREGVDFVLRQQQAGNKVLIACGAGMSRSPTFAVAALKESEGLGLLEALKQVADHHRDTLIHPVLWASLCVYYAEAVPLAKAMAIMVPRD